MEIFNIIGGVYSIIGLAVSLFIDDKVVKITQNINYGNKNDYFKVINMGKRNTYNGLYTGRDNIGEGRNRE